MGKKQGMASLSNTAAAGQTVANLQTMQRLHSVFYPPMFPLNTMGNVYRVDPVGLGFQLTGNLTAAGLVAGLAAGTITEDDYNGLAGTNGYYASRGEMPGQRWQGFMSGISLDVEPSIDDGATTPTLVELTRIVSSLNFELLGSGIRRVIPARECAVVFPNAHAPANRGITGACPGSGKPTYIIPGGFPWNGDEACDIKVVANSSLTFAFPPALRFRFRLWGTLGIIPNEQDTGKVENGSIPTSGTVDGPPCEDAGAAFAVVQGYLHNPIALNPR